MVAVAPDDEEGHEPGGEVDGDEDHDPGGVVHGVQVGGVEQSLQSLDDGAEAKGE